MDVLNFIIAYEHTTNVFNLLFGGLTSVLIMMTIIEHYLETNNNEEVSGLLDSEPKSEVGEIQVWDVRDWKGLLNRNIENFVPFFLSIIPFELYIGSTLLFRHNFNAILISILILKYLYLFSRVIHFIGYKIGVKSVRTTGFALSGITNITLSIMVAVVSFLGKGKSQTVMVGVRILTVTIVVVVIKIYSVLTSAHKTKYFDEDTLLSIRLEHMSRNDAENFVPLCGFLPIWILAYIYLESDLISQSEAKVVTCWSLLILYTVLRICYSISYYNRWQPSRSIIYFVGILVLIAYGLSGYGILIRFMRTVTDSTVTFPLACVSLVVVDILRTTAVAFLTGYYRFRREKSTILNPEDCIFAYNEQEEIISVSRSNEISVRAEIPSSLKFLRIHNLDLAFGMLFFYIIFISKITDLTKEKNGVLIAIVTIFVATRFLPLVAEFVKTRYQNQEMFKMVVQLFSLTWLVILLLWSFISMVINITHR